MSKNNRTVLRYAGGKTKGIKKITPFVTGYDKVVSPFIGGGSLEVHWALQGKEVVGNDIFDILVTFWNSLLNTPKQLADELRKIKPTKEEYDRIKEELKQTPQVQNMLKDWKTDYYVRSPKELDPIKLAAYYYFNHNCSYGPGFLGWPSKLYMNQKRWDGMISKIENFECPNLKVTNLDFAEVIKKHPSDFLYLDPPYLLDKSSEDNKMFSGIYPMRNIPVHHNSFDHELLRELLLSHKGDFVLSYNNCDKIREMYSDFDFYYPEWHYSMSLGETRIGKNRNKTPDQDNRKESHEILIVKRTHS